MHWRTAFNVAYTFTGRHEQAEDLTQDVFVRLFKSLKRFDSPANFQTWLSSVSRNFCIDCYRGARKERETVARDVDPAAPRPVWPAADVEAELQARDRVALLRDIQELSYQEIEQQPDLPEGAMKSRINRWRSELARHVRDLRSTQEFVGAKE